MRNSSLGADSSLQEIFGLVAGLAQRERRREAASALAAHLGGEELALFAPDPELGVPLPAPGLPQTLHGAAEWRAFLEECARSGEHAGTLRRSDGRASPAVGCASVEGTAAVLLGEGLPARGLEPLRPLLPLLGSLFQNERRVDAGDLRARSATEAMERSRVLTRALQDARGSLEGALAEAEEARKEARARAEQAESLAAELHAQAAQLQDQALELEVLNEELQVRSDEAEAARAAADAANRAKSDFLANMSHELRTPINAVIGYAELLAIGVTGPVTPEQKAQLERIRVSSAHLLTLVNDVLDLAKVEAGRMTVEHGREIAVETVREALSLVEVQAAEKGIGVRAGCEDDSVVYFGDRDRVRQILANLLSNAVKFTGKGGTVSVRCGEKREPEIPAQLAGEGPWTCIEVEDTGIGIGPEEVARVFQPFVQAESGRTRSHGGTGLGLTISRQLARLMGGDLTVQSERGKGSRFSLWLPSAAPARSTLDEAIRAGASGRGGARPVGLAAVGEAIQAELGRIVSAYARRLRSDARLPAAPLEDGDLLGLAPVLVADVAALLMKLDRSGGDAAALQDGSDVQRLIAERHGAERGRRGWTMDGLRREFVILREELVRTAEGAAAAHPAIDLPGVLGVLDQLLEAGRRASLASLLAAAVGDTSAAQA